MKRTFRPDVPNFLCLTLLAVFWCASTASAQLPWRWLGAKSTEAARPSAAAPMPDARRIAEVNVEIAWLADSVTFPYYLEAHVANSQLEVRGYVPNKMVRDQALRIAQVYSSLPVADALKEHSSLLVRPSKMSPQQLQNSVQSSLRVALPRQSGQFKIECGADGKVLVSGPVDSYEEKIAVSHALRRLHGCTSVQNLTTVSADVAQVPATLLPKEKAPIIKVSNPGAKPVVAVPDRPAGTKSRWLFWPFNKGTIAKDEPPLLEPRQPEAEKSDRPIVIPTAPEPKSTPEVIQAETPNSPPNKQAPGMPLTAAALQQRILAACKQAKGAEVQFTSPTEVRIAVDVRADNEVGPTAEVILALPELRNYRPDLLFKVVSP